MRLDLHVHSDHSGDSIATVESIVKAAKKRGLDGFALTDHNTIDGWREAARLCKAAGLVFIPAEEVSTTHGHVLALGIKKMVEPWRSPEDIINDIHKQRGLAVAAHPFDLFRPALGNLVYGLKIDGIETVNGHAVYGNKQAVIAATAIGVRATGGSDAHTAIEVGNAWTEAASPSLKSAKPGGGYVAHRVIPTTVFRKIVRPFRRKR
jgi:predicted metal-dependent phosphoesterase TrpH